MKDFNFRRSDSVVVIIRGAGTKTASGPYHIQSVSKKGVVLLVGSNLKYDATTGEEIEPAVHGFHSEIIKFEG